jgi:rubrerythrin
LHLLITFVLTMFLLVYFLFRRSFSGMYNHNARRDKDVDITFETLVACPKCGDYYSGNPNFCPNCGIHLKED